VRADGGSSVAGRHHGGKLAALEEDKPPGQAAVEGDPLAHIGGIELVDDLGAEWACDLAAVRRPPPCGVKTKHGLRRSANLPARQEADRQRAGRQAGAVDDDRFAAAAGFGYREPPLSEGKKARREARLRS
jgi:hypothetical protein